MVLYISYNLIWKYPEYRAGRGSILFLTESRYFLCIIFSLRHRIISDNYQTPAVLPGRIAEYLGLSADIVFGTLNTLLSRVGLPGGVGIGR